MQTSETTLETRNARDGEGGGGETAAGPRRAPRRVVVELRLPFAVSGVADARAHRGLGRQARGGLPGGPAPRDRRERVGISRTAVAWPARVALGGGIATNAPAEELWPTCTHAAGRASRSRRARPRAAGGAICNVSGASMPFLRRAGVTRFDFELLALDSADFARLNHADALQDFNYVVDSFLRAYSNKTLGIVLAYGFDARDTPGVQAVDRPVPRACRPTTSCSSRGPGSASRAPFGGAWRPPRARRGARRPRQRGVRRIRPPALPRAAGRRGPVLGAPAARCRRHARRRRPLRGDRLRARGDDPLRGRGERQHRQLETYLARARTTRHDHGQSRANRDPLTRRKPVDPAPGSRRKAPSSERTRTRRPRRASRMRRSRTISFRPQMGGGAAPTRAYVPGRQSPVVSQAGRHRRPGRIRVPRPPRRAPATPGTPRRPSRRRP